MLSPLIMVWASSIYAHIQLQLNIWVYILGLGQKPLKSEDLYRKRGDSLSFWPMVCVNVVSSSFFLFLILLRDMWLDWRYFLCCNGVAIVQLWSCRLALRFPGLLSFISFFLILLLHLNTWYTDSTDQTQTSNKYSSLAILSQWIVTLFQTHFALVLSLLSISGGRRPERLRVLCEDLVVHLDVCTHGCIHRRPRRMTVSQRSQVAGCEWKSTGSSPGGPILFLPFSSILDAAEPLEQWVVSNRVNCLWSLSDDDMVLPLFNSLAANLALS